MEVPNVIESYSKIASHFDKTRVMIWQFVKKFVEEMDRTKPITIYDVGCGNGKNMSYIIDTTKENDHVVTVKGCDLTQEFVDICRGKNLDVVNGDILNIPFENESADYVICIAVLHHMMTISDRTKALTELLRILKKGGKIALSVTAYYEYKPEDKGDKLKCFYRNIKPIDGNIYDVLVPWRNIDNNTTVDRYYHLFQENEIDEILMQLDCTIVYKCNENNNWIYFIEKN